MSMEKKDMNNDYNDFTKDQCDELAERTKFYADKYVLVGRMEGYYED